MAFRIAVTGSSGFIGTHVVLELVAAGHDVVGIDSRPAGHGVATVVADLRSADVAPVLRGADAVVHLAGLPGVHPSWQDFGAYLEVNAEVTKRVLDAVPPTVRSFVLASSSSTGCGGAPTSPYGVSKLAAEATCRLYEAARGVPAAVLRLFTVYGPGQRADMAFARLRHAALTGTPFVLHGDGGQTRDFTYVADTARAIRLAVESGWSGTADVATGAATSLADAVALARELFPELDVEQRPLPSPEARHTLGDTSTARDGFGFEAAVTLDEGLRRMLTDSPTALQPA